ncbi:MAG: hypothetical protein WA460_09795 [Nitrososphaeraceae archaeon]
MKTQAAQQGQSLRKLPITAFYFPLQFHNFHLHQISREIIFGHKYTNDLAIEESTMATE